MVGAVVGSVVETVVVSSVSARASAVAQTGVGEFPGSGVDAFFGVAGSAVGAFLTTLLVGAILVALAPAYTERVMDRVREDPLGSFLYGVASLLFVVVVTVLLVFTFIGIPLAILFGVAAFVLWAVGAAVAYLAIAEALVGRDGDSWLRPLAVGAAINGGLALTGIGGIVSFCVGAAGFGAVLRDWLE